MRNIAVNSDIAAPRSSVWAVLADFPGISKWNGGIKNSFSTSEATTGVGAKRHCDLVPMGELEETVAEWVPEEKLVVSIDKASKIPLKSGLATFELIDGGDVTPTTINYEYEPKGGPLARIFGPMLDRQLTKGFNGFLADLEAEAKQQTPA